MFNCLLGKVGFRVLGFWFRGAIQELNSQLWAQVFQGVPSLRFMLVLGVGPQISIPDVYHKDVPGQVKTSTRQSTQCVQQYKRTYLFLTFLRLPALSVYESRRCHVTVFLRAYYLALLLLLLQLLLLLLLLLVDFCRVGGKQQEIPAPITKHPNPSYFVFRLSAMYGGMFDISRVFGLKSETLNLQPEPARGGGIRTHPPLCQPFTTLKLSLPDRNRFHDSFQKSGFWVSGSGFRVGELSWRALEEV